MIIVPNDAKVSRAFIYGSRQTYFACPLLDTMDSAKYSVSLTASFVGNLYIVIVATKAFNLPCFIHPYICGPIDRKTITPDEK